MTHTLCQYAEIHYDELKSIFFDLERKTIGSNSKSSDKIYDLSSESSVKNGMSINEMNTKKEIVCLLKIDYNKPNPVSKKLKEQIAQYCRSQSE